MEQTRGVTVTVKKFMFCMICLSGLLFIRYWDQSINRMNATMFAFSYKYGFISRGLIGSIYQVLDKILPVDLMNYTWLVRYNFAATLIYVAILLLFIFLCIRKCNASESISLTYIAVFFLIFAVPMFVGEFNFGRSDMYCVMLSLVGVMLLMYEKAEWLIIPISAAGVMVHQGYVFMFYNVLLVFLFCKILSTDGKKRRKYALIFIVSLIVCGILFFWFELFSHANGDKIYEDVVATATSICKDGWYHIDVIDKEIRGIDLSDREIVWRKYNAIQFPLFLAMMSPYIMIGINIFKKLVRHAGSKCEKWKYIVLSAGAATIVPNLLLKVDYGRWMFAVIFYYCVVFMVMMFTGDALAVQTVSDVFSKITKRCPFCVLLLIYPLLFQPLGDVSICGVTERIADIINYNMIHWWTLEDTIMAFVQGIGRG